MGSQSMDLNCPNCSCKVEKFSTACPQCKFSIPQAREYKRPKTAPVTQLARVIGGLICGIVLIFVSASAFNALTLDRTAKALPSGWEYYKTDCDGYELVCKTAPYRNDPGGSELGCQGVDAVDLEHPDATAVSWNEAIGYTYLSNSCKRVQPESVPKKWRSALLAKASESTFWNGPADLEK